MVLEASFWAYIGAVLGSEKMLLGCHAGLNAACVAQVVTE